MYPVFSLVLDKDVTPETALMYPELYKDLTKVMFDVYILQNNNKEHVKVVIKMLFRNFQHV